MKCNVYFPPQPAGAGDVPGPRHSVRVLPAGPAAPAPQAAVDAGEQTNLAFFAVREQKNPKPYLI